MNVFGPAITTHRGNKVVIGIAASLAVISAYLGWMSLHVPESDSPGDYQFYVAAAVILALYAFWTSRKMVSLHAEGISYSNLLGEKQMRWDDVQKFYYSATKRSVNFIPIGTYYSFKLVDGSGNKISFGNGIAQPKALGQKLVELTQEPLVKKIAHQFDNGAEVDLGAIKLNREKGLIVKKFFGGWKQVPLNTVHSYSVQSGQFYIWSNDQKLVCSPAIADVANAFALLGFLNILFQPKAHSAHAT
jgi:hypothetical protein